MDFVRNTAEGSRYREMASKIEDTLRFMKVSTSLVHSDMLCRLTDVGPTLLMSWLVCTIQTVRMQKLQYGDVGTRLR